MNKNKDKAIEGLTTKYSKIYNEIEQELKDSEKNKGRAWHVIAMNKSRFCKEILEDLKYIASLSDSPESDDIDSISESPCPEELWDANSELIGSDISDLDYYAGRNVMLKSNFLKAIERLTPQDSH